MDKLKEYEKYTDNIKPFTFHFALIKGENDHLDDVKKMADIIDSYDFKQTKLNIVGFNPHPSLNYEESDKVNDIFEIMKNVVNDVNIQTNKSRIVDRVGKDVYASCGMFVS